jgi:hypothetical protein
LQFFGLSTPFDENLTRHTQLHRTFRKGVEFVSWQEALQKKVEKERLLFDQVQVLWPPKDADGADLASSSAARGEESAEESVDLDDKPAKTAFLKTKPLRVYGGDRVQTLVPGTYTYHLKWKLPAGLPLVFEDSTSATWMASEGAMVPKMLSKGKSFIRYYATASLTTCKQIQVPTELGASIPSASGSAAPFSSQASSSAAPSSSNVEAAIPPVRTTVIKEVNKTSSTRAYFKVVEDIPLAALTNQPPIQAIQEKTFLFGGDLPLKLSVTIANGGLAFAGKSFNATISVDNKSTRNVEAVKIGIDCITTFRVAAPRVAPVQAGLAGSQVQALHPEVIRQQPSSSAEANAANNGNPDATEWIDNVTRKENVLLTTLGELANIQAASTRTSTISVSIPAYWPGSIVTSVHIERRYEVWAECVITMGTNLITRCPLRLLEWCEHFTRTMPDLAPVVRDIEEFEISDDEEYLPPLSSSSSSASSAPASNAASPKPQPHQAIVVPPQPASGASMEDPAL